MKYSEFHAILVKTIPTFRQVTIEKQYFSSEKRNLFNIKIKSINFKMLGIEFERNIA